MRRIPLLLAALCLPAFGQDSPILRTIGPVTVVSKAFAGPLPPAFCREGDAACLKAYGVDAAPPVSLDCGQASCPYSPPADTTLDRIDPCAGANPPASCANRAKAERLAENKDGWTKIANETYRNSAGFVTTCQANPAIPPCLAEQKIKDFAAKRRGLSADRQWQADHSNLNGGGAIGAASDEPGGGVSAGPPSDYRDQIEKTGDAITEANGFDDDSSRPSSAAAPQDYGSTSRTLKGILKGGNRGASGSAHAAQDDSANVQTELAAPPGGGFLSRLKAMAGRVFEGPSAGASAPDDTLAPKREAMEGSKAAPKNP